MYQTKIHYFHHIYVVSIIDNLLIIFYKTPIILFSMYETKVIHLKFRYVNKIQRFYEYNYQCIISQSKIIYLKIIELKTGR